MEDVLYAIDRIIENLKMVEEGVIDYVGNSPEETLWEFTEDVFNIDESIDLILEIRRLTRFLEGKVLIEKRRVAKIEEKEE